MKQLFLILSFISICTACNTVERGAAENDTLSRKLFDTLRDNDFDKYVILIPDKGTFRKIQEHNGQEMEDVNKVYEEALQTAENRFNDTRSMFGKWETCKFLHNTVEPSKYGNLPSEVITIKFNGDGGPYKVTVTSVKFNNRWYCMGDLNWVVKTD
jgi:hypothetical protein